MEILKKILAGILAAALILVMLPAPAQALELEIPLETEETLPETTVPQTTLPEETVPEETIPETTVPEETEAAVPETPQISAPVPPQIPVEPETAAGRQEVIADTQVQVFSHSGDLNAQAPTKQQIAQMYHAITAPTSIFAETPSVRAPYAAGWLSDSYLQNGLAWLNFARTAANLPLLQLDDQITDYAQHGAVLLAAIDTLTHYPTKPSDMDNDFFQKGYQATTSSNISYNYGYSAQESLAVGILGCLDDSDPYNIDRVGHRRWFMNPQLLKVGFGYAQSSTCRNYSVMKVFDRSGSAEYDFVAYPAAGNFPTQLFDGGVVWSVSLNPAKFQIPSRNDLTITITRQSDGRSWTLDSGTGTPVNNSVACLSVETGGYGIANCIIFSPGSSNVSRYSGIHTVEITGLRTRSGSPAKLEYQVDFFDAEDYESHTCSYTPQVTAPTCTERGYTTYTCSCGNSYVEDYVEATGHSYGQWMVTRQPTVTETGEERRDCENCDHFETREIPQLAEQILFGDVNGNGVINVQDRLVLTRYLAGWSGYPASAIDFEAADVNEDGRVNTLDRLILTRFLAQWSGYERLPYSG